MGHSVWQIGGKVSPAPALYQQHLFAEDSYPGREQRRGGNFLGWLEKVFKKCVDVALQDMV